MSTHSLPPFTRALGLLLLAAVLAGCGERHLQHRVIDAGRGAEWQTEGSVDSAPLVLGSPRFDGSALSFEVLSRRVQREYGFDTYYDETRRVKAPNVLAMAVGATTLGLFCVVSSDECFGDTGDWNRSSKRKRNVAPTGRTRPLVETYGSTVNARVQVQGLDAGGAQVAVTEADFTGSRGLLNVPLKGLVEQMPVRPAQLNVAAFVRNRQGGITQHRLSPAELARLQPSAEHWLPAAERQALVIERLKKRLIEGDHAGALPHFAALEALPVALPGSFLYMYAQSLLKTGARDRAHGYLQKYLDGSGENGLYAAEARALLAAR